ncbi:MAG: hypothetical protein ACR2NH_01420 [Solirubrobacteraceae bacterium]
MASEPEPTRVLVVAARTAATPALIEAVRERAARGPCRFTLLVPNVVSRLDAATDAEDQGPRAARSRTASIRAGVASDSVIELATPLLEEAAGGPVDSVVGDAEPLAAIQDALNLTGFDEIILSTLPVRVSRWLHLDLPRKVAGLGVPVTTITAKAREGGTG